MTILDRIARYKREEVGSAKARTPLSALEKRISELPPARGFRAALEQKRAHGEFGLIAEIKRASPSKGVIRDDFDPVTLARAYREGGAACLSVLTDAPSFQGSLEHLALIRSAVDLPILRKDFMLDPYQVAEARASGADCILIILAMADDAIARDLFAAARHYGLDTLVEVHNDEERGRALSLASGMVGINNRDLKTFETDLNVTLRLARKIPDSVLVVSESGLSSRADLERLTKSGVTTFLIGESLMRQADVTTATRAVIGGRIRP
jgi:indole-3-glycerol phosphate synthase